MNHEQQTDTQRNRSTAEAEHRRVRYTGRVQGVGFRATCRSISKHFPNITGTIKNEDDGSVTLHAQGPTDQLEAFLDTIQHQMAANIEHADTQTQPPDPNLTDFRIVH